MILFNFSVDITTPPFCGIAPPLKPVPAPRGVTGIKRSLQYFKILLISLAVDGFTTTSGGYNNFYVSSWP